MIVMEDGKVAEAGTHEELMSREGIYFGMVKKHDEALKLREVI
jgi:ATP-binding cassette subfamily B protein